MIFFLLVQARKRWAEGRPEVIIDPLLGEKPSNKIIKLIQTGLLCVQQNATKRPTMSTVIVWLGSESTITIHSTKTPASTSSHSQSEDGTMSMSNVFTDLTYIAFSCSFENYNVFFGGVDVLLF
ncbi:hypothetical protein YC2023_037627 [Brassica napus]